MALGGRLAEAVSPTAPDASNFGRFLPPFGCRTVGEREGEGDGKGGSFFLTALFGGEVGAAASSVG